MEKYRKLTEQIIKKNSICYIGSITDEGYPKIRAMLLPVKQEGNSFWFHTNTSSSKVEQFKNNPNASVYFCDAGSFTGVVYLGRMEIFEDQETKNSFWKNGYEMYYAGGVTSPDFCVMKFTASQGDFYGNFTVTKFDMQ